MTSLDRDAQRMANELARSSVRGPAGHQPISQAGQGAGPSPAVMARRPGRHGRRVRQWPIQRRPTDVLPLGHGPTYRATTAWQVDAIASG